MLFICYVLGPSMLFGIIGWKSSGAERPSHTVIFAMLVMSVLTFMFYLTSYALSR